MFQKFISWFYKRPNFNAEDYKASVANLITSSLEISYALGTNYQVQFYIQQGTPKVWHLLRTEHLLDWLPETEDQYFKFNPFASFKMLVFNRYRELLVTYERCEGGTEIIKTQHRTI